MITAEDITAALGALGVERSDTLFVHSDLRRCLRVAGETREQKLETIVGGLEAGVPDGTLILPAFSYSFCRDEPFDVRDTPAAVGVLAEHFRGRPRVRRTADPIFSTSVLGRVPPSWASHLFAIGDKDCFGEHSVFAYLLESDAKLLFLGVAPTACTFIHHVEQRERVPYRYFKEFRGPVSDGPSTALVTARYYVRELDSDVETFLVPLMEVLRGRGQLAATRFERGPVLSLVRARDVARAAVAGLGESPSFLLQRGHPQLAHLRYG